jgi:DNA-binding MarR family transcriptional regulator
VARTDSSSSDRPDDADDADDAVEDTAGASGAAGERASDGAGGRTLPPRPFVESVGFLLSQAGDATARHFKGALAELAIEPRHFAVMRTIETAENRSQQALAEALHIPASSMVAVLDQLEERGIVARRLDPSDRRVRLVELTPDGAELMRHAIARALQVERRVCGGLSPAQRRTLLELLRRVAANLDLRAGEHPSRGDEHAGRHC